MQQTAFDREKPGTHGNVPLVQIEHLSHYIQTPAQKITILNDITFSIPMQSFFAVIGPSGSGKSALLNMLTGIDRPTGGRILFACLALFSGSTRVSNHR